jgi:DNA-binding MarR family transcriptional regulator
MTDTLGDLLIQDISRTRRAIHKRMRTNGRLPSLTGSQVELLRVVEANPGVGVSSAARTLGLAGNSVSALINQLVTTGYLRREVDDEDRRAARLYLTVEAAKRLKRWRDARTNLVCEALSMLAAEDRAALEDARPALRRLSEAIDRAFVTSNPRLNGRAFVAGRRA